MLHSTTISSAQAFKILAWFVVLLWVFTIFLQKTNLAASDLGRHVTNGKEIIESGHVFQNNHYSYTNPEYSAPNHHWLYGVLAWRLYQVGGFPLITVVVAGCYWLGVVGMMVLSKKINGDWATLLATVILIPIMNMRIETRPDALSVLFLSTTILACHWVWRKQSWREILPAVGALFIVTAFWVNLHILFIVGLIVTASYLLQAFIRRSAEQVQKYAVLLVAQLAAALINPLGISTLFYPLLILRDYQYPVAENQSVLFFLQHHPSTTYWYLALVLMAGAIALVSSYKKVALQLQPIWIITAILLFATALMHRFSVFLQLPLLVVLSSTGVLIASSKRWRNRRSLLFGIGIGVVLFVALTTFTTKSAVFSPSFGTGTLPNVEAAGAFFKQHQLPGPIFNNYDIGGYLIYMLYPQHRVFVDNRPEAYPGSFMTDHYISAQSDENVWQALEKTHHFNTIFFYRHDATDWAIPFLIRRIEDESWVPVHVDDYVVILLKNTPENSAQFADITLPKSIFFIQK